MKFLILALFGSLAASALSQPLVEEDESYKPYSFRYETQDPDGNAVQREQSQDSNGNIISKVIEISREGLKRITTTVAHPVDGTSVNVETNEPGVISHESANAVYVLL